ncbi:MAG: EAL domain-containing protein [Chloroflexota bacterium]
MIDAAILATGAGSLFWMAIAHPSVSGVVDPLAATVSLVYPAMDLLLLTLGLRVALTAVARPRYLLFLVLGMTLYFIADVLYALLTLSGTYMSGNPVDAGWIVGILLIGVAALHPSTRTAVAPVERIAPRISRVRLALFALAALAAPAILFTRTSAGSEEFGLIVEWVLLFGLVLVRLSTTVDQLALSLRERQQLQTELAYGASHDPLTQLANRTLFEARLAQAMAQTPSTTAVIFLDVDDFKSINDTLGHPTGDEVLRVAAARLASNLRGTDLPARVGGDEFAILVESCADAASACAVAERAVSALRAPVTIGGHRILVHASAGVAMSTARSTDVDLMREADIAMYAAKAGGKDQVHEYASGMQAQITRNYELRTELAEALALNQFVLHYQPGVDLGTGMVVGAEALVRWEHPVRGLLPPAEFIPDAELSGLIHPLGKWILREACTSAAAWPDRPDGQRPTISVNLAAGQLLEPGFVKDVAAILAQTGLKPSNLLLEVTESALINGKVAGAALNRLRALGVMLALDDFGTGYSSLGYLAELPFNFVKIDKSFVAGIGHAGRIDSLLQDVLRLCSGLELQTVAEGIETPLQLNTLREMGCRFGQGYLFARAVPAAEFVRLMASAQLGGVLPGIVTDIRRPKADRPAKDGGGFRSRRPVSAILKPAALARSWENWWATLGSNQ